jgi:CRISPR-associated protein Cmr4
MNTRLLCLHARSSIHCGTGQAIGGIDLPIAREKPTNIPLVPGSSVKGVLRALLDDRDESSSRHREHITAFGPRTENASDHGGSLHFGDLRLVFLPVRSVRGTFAWVSSPYLLHRFARDAKEAGLSFPSVTDPGDPRCLVAQGSRLRVERRVAFEDFDFEAHESKELTELAESFAKKCLDAGEVEFFKSRVCVVSDDVMSVLLLTCTELSTRIRLDPDKKTVEKGALWTEEALPVESLLVGVVLAAPVPSRKTTPNDLFAHLRWLLDLQGGALQVGGNATVGHGVCRARLVGGED